MLQAMNTGHDGSLTTAHANAPRDCLSRLEVMVMMTGMDLTMTAIREQIASAVHLIVQQNRFSCGSRKITSICELTGIENGRIQLAEIFRFRQQGFDQAGKVVGTFEATGLVPQFYEDLHRRGIDVDMRVFGRMEGEH
jgi:pilus assembly protein CpaF